MRAVLTLLKFHGRDRLLAALEQNIAIFLSVRSAATRRQYKTTLKQWVEFVGEDKILRATSREALLWIAALKDRPGIPSRFNVKIHRQAPATIDTKVTCLRKLYKHLQSTNTKPAENPFDPEVLPRGVTQKCNIKRPTEALDPDQVMRLVNAPTGNGKKAIRDRAVFALLFASGMRPAEVCALTAADVSLEPPRVRLLQTKNGETVLQPFAEWATPYIQTLIEKKFPHESLFDLSTRTLHRRFRAACFKCGLKGSYSPHSARATVTTLLRSQGVDTRSIMELLRHKTPRMVEVYDKRRFGADNKCVSKIIYNKLK